ncbi:PoNe immunity protein domain-containing protein [Basilea psittacipulmonis]|uniref:PoNe immunity protein domain-containing protein n=1 Tax=Basilea psittacipulmonis TaxID=1472345 RepID=UPI0013013E49|nr:PoNe immunity protein domain-containing protein [Basilea psittacipulmonis]
MNTLENYKANILFNRNAISKRYEKINYLKNDEVNNIQRNKKTNSNIIQSILETIFEYQSEILISTYSAGFSIMVQQKSIVLQNLPKTDLFDNKLLFK